MDFLFTCVTAFQVGGRKMVLLTFNSPYVYHYGSSKFVIGYLSIPISFQTKITEHQASIIRPKFHCNIKIDANLQIYLKDIIIHIRVCLSICFKY